MLGSAERLFDILEAGWSAPKTRRLSATMFVTVFVGSLALIEMAQRGWLPSRISSGIPESHFAAVSLVFSFLLLFEIAGLVFSLPRSVAESVGKQFELLALILLREAFLEFAHASEPIEWANVADSVPYVVTDMAGALAVFALLIPFHRIQRHKSITTDELDQTSFVAAKKVVSLALLGTFVLLGISTLAETLQGRTAAPFFPTFYTVLVLGDILVVLISLRFSATFHVVFRNAGFAAAVVLVRVALSAPPYINIALAIAATAFALGLSYLYNAWPKSEAVA